jgi:hypothetical protein
VTDHESDRETESEDDDIHARTAKLLFGVPGRSQMVGSQGISQGGIRRSSESLLDGRILVQEGSEEDSPDSKVPPALHAFTPPVSECNSQQTFANGTYRCRTNSDVPSLQPQLINSINTKDARVMRLGDADHKPSFRALAYTSSVSSLTSPARNQSHRTSRHDPPLMDLQNIPLAGTKRAPVHLCFSTPARKRSKVEGWPNACAEEDSVLAFPRREENSVPGVAAMEAWKSTDAAPESGCTRERGPDVSGETRRSQRRALRARSRAIEEKLRNALAANCNGSEIESYFGK